MRCALVIGRRYSSRMAALTASSSAPTERGYVDLVDVFRPGKATCHPLLFVVTVIRGCAELRHQTRNHGTRCRGQSDEAHRDAVVQKVSRIDPHYV